MHRMAWRGLVIKGKSTKDFYFCNNRLYFTFIFSPFMVLFLFSLQCLVWLNNRFGNCGFVFVGECLFGMLSKKQFWNVLNSRRAHMFGVCIICTTYIYRWCDEMNWWGFKRIHILNKKIVSKNCANIIVLLVFRGKKEQRRADEKVEWKFVFHIYS